MMHRVLAVLVAMLAAWPAAAHRSSDAFLQIHTEGSAVSGRWEIALRDLEAAIGLDANGDRDITWGELRAVAPRIEALLGYIDLSDAAGGCPLRADGLKVNQRSDGPYASLAFAGRCPGGAEELSVRYDFLFTVDPSHRLILTLASRDGADATAVLGPDGQRFVLDSDGGGRLVQFGSYLREGMFHIWAGYDHILFLVTLLLPCVLLRAGGRWEPAPRMWGAMREVIVVVTAFTLAHSITLGVAAFELVSLPSRLVESVIALTVVLAALNNLFPIITTKRYAVALGFGLIHGFGFASALGDIGVPDSLRLLGLAGFNLGVELGQLAIVAVVVPVLYVLRRAALYRPLVLHGGSLAVAGMACVWFMQRAIPGG